GSGHAPRPDERRDRGRCERRARNSFAHRDAGGERRRRADGPLVSARRRGRSPGATRGARMRFDRHAFEAKGHLVVPGFIDLHAHLREPGFEDSETIETGRRAALRGGFTTICAMPNTEPPIDSPGLVKELLGRGHGVNGARVHYVATITRGRKGRELADMVELAAAGAVAFSDDGSPVQDPRLFRSALEYARVTGRP